MSLLPLESAHPLLCTHQPGHSSQFGHLPGDVVTQSPQLPVGLAAAVPPVGLGQGGLTRARCCCFMRSGVASPRPPVLPAHPPQPPATPDLLLVPQPRLFQNAVELESHDAQSMQSRPPFQTGFSDLAVCVQVSSMSFQTSMVHVFFCA